MLPLLLACRFGGLRWVLAQVLMKNGKIPFSGTVDTLYYVAPCMSLTLLPFALAFEVRDLANSTQLATGAAAATTVGTVLFG